MKNNKSAFRRIVTSEVFLGIVGVAVYLGYLGIKEYSSNNWNQGRIEKKYIQNLVLIKHEYAIKVFFDDPQEEPIYLVKDTAGNYQQWKKGMSPNAVFACGFIINRKGDCVTSKKTMYPYPVDWDKVALTKEINLFREMFDFRSRGHYEIFTIRAGYYPQGTSANNEDAFIACSFTGYFDGGITMMKAKFPDKAFNKLPEFSLVQYRNILQTGDKVSVLGLPVEMDHADNITGVSSQAVIDSIENVPGSMKNDRELFFRLPSLFMTEGAPVFNRKGNVVGVMTFDNEGYKAYFTLLEHKK